MTNSNRTVERAIAFCAALAETANIGRACTAIGMGRSTAYDWRDDDPEFASAWDRAMQIGVTALEDEAKRRAFEGVEEPIIHQGQIQYEVREKLNKAGKPIIDRTTKLPKMEVVRNKDGTRKMATVRKYSDNLVGILLKAHAPDKYRENSKVEMSGSLEFSNLSDSEIQEQIDQIQAQLATAAAMPKPAAPAEPQEDDFNVPD